MQILFQNPQLDFSSQTKSLSVGSSLLVLLSDGLIPLQQKPIVLPTNAESQAGPKQGNEDSLWQISQGMRSIGMSVVRYVHSLLPLLCPHSPTYKTYCRDLRLKGWSSQKPQDVQWRGLATSQSFCSMSPSPSCRPGEAREWFQEWNFYPTEVKWKFIDCNGGRISFHIVI